MTQLRSVGCCCIHATIVAWVNTQQRLEMASNTNGRLAMVGFMLGVLIEWLTGYGMAQQLGLGLLRRHL